MQLLSVVTVTFSTAVGGKIVDTGTQLVYYIFVFSKWVRNGFQERANVFIWLRQSFSICIMDSILIIHTWKEEGEGDFHYFNISLLATVNPSSNGCRIIVGIVLVICKQPKIASAGSGWRGLRYALEYQSSILDQKFANEEQEQKAWDSVPSDILHLSHTGETDRYIL